MGKNHVMGFAHALGHWVIKRDRKQNVNIQPRVKLFYTMLFCFLHSRKILLCKDLAAAISRRTS